MKEFSAPELRKWANDMEHFFGSSARLEMLAKAEAHAHRMRAKAALIDAEEGVDTGTAEVAEVVQGLPIVGKVAVRGGKRVSIERPYNGEGEPYGIHTAWEWRDDPTAEEQTGSLCRLYIGTEQHGPVAMYDADQDQWHALNSRGNFGKRYACGGNFSSKKVSEQPEIVKTLEVIMDKAERVEKAKMRLQAANKRVLAAHQMESAAAYDRQAMNPAYDDQSIICLGKADITRAYAQRTIAEAELLEAHAA